ncbi:MAG: alpha/beta fold hydrolase, partial [Dehalococcoidia bacterium]
MQEKTIDVRKGMFKTEVIEDGSGEPLLFFHGVNGVQPGDPFLTRLAEQYHVIAPRMPGFGDSTGTEQLLD